MRKKSNNNKSTKWIIYISSTVTSKSFSDLFFKSGKMPGQQIQKFHRLFLEGLSTNDVKLIAISSLPVTRGTTKKVFFCGKTIYENNVKFKYLPTINIRYIRYFLNLLFSFFATFFSTIFKKNVRIICDPLNVSATSGAIFAAKLLNKTTCGIITDFPEHLYCSSSMKIKYNDFLIKKMDYYVFLVEAMNEKVNKKNKPYIVIEGLVDAKIRFSNNELNSKYSNKVVMYAGKLDQKYGICNLIHGFINANIDGAELHIYGNGDSEKMVIQATNEFPNIKYFGTINNEKLIIEEQKASLLVNPRPTNEEFTIYSFPSKNLEYMVSGTPLLTTKLSGIPSEYFQYSYIIDSFDSKGISKSLIEVLKFSSEELHRKGLRAKEFVLAEKNNLIQSKKLYDFLFQTKG